MAKAKNSTDLVAGIEGGGTRSEIVLLDGSNGHIISRAQGEGTNHWLVGIEEVVTRIGALVKAAKEAASVPDETPLRALGLSLSGADKAEEKAHILNELSSRFPRVCGEARIYNDTMGGLATAAGPTSGGIVIIAGTGSNCRLVVPLSSPDGGTNGEELACFNCGGWGHMLGDEGSAFWIAQAGVKAVYDVDDGFGPAESPFDVTELRRRMEAYFDIKNRFDIIAHLYSKFDKSKFAAFAVEIASAAAGGDPLSLHIFSRAGRVLARHVVAVLRKAGAAATALTELDRKKDAEQQLLKVVCIGSVWKSWALLRPGFVAEMEETAGKSSTGASGTKSVIAATTCIRLDLVRLTTSGAVGAAYLAAAAEGREINCDLSANYDTMDQLDVVCGVMHA